MQVAATAEKPAFGEDSPLIELGWSLTGDLSPLERRAVRSAREALHEQLEETFPQFRWRMPETRHPATRVALLEEPSVRLHEAVQEREARRWDFAFVVTSRDLRSYTKSYALAVPSRALAVAVISLARLAPSRPDSRSDAEPDAEDVLARRLRTLSLHLFGDLNGLWHRGTPDAVMTPPASVRDLDRAPGFDADELEALGVALAEVADLRLEERLGASRAPGALRFYLRAGCERAGEIGSAVARARPWEFPLRLGRLTAAALSALFILLLTAEVWDLGAAQRPEAVALLSLLVLAATTAFLLSRQKLTLRRGRGRVGEQAVVMNLSASLIVLVGMATAYAALFALTLGVGLVLYPPELLARWAPSVEGADPLGLRLRMAGVVSSLGLLIGCLGASLEGHAYLRHVIYADEET